MTYLCTFSIFVHMHTIFMDNVDFISHPYTLCNIWNFHVKCTDFGQSYTWTHFQFMMQLDVLFAISIKINDIFGTFRIFVYLYTIFMHNVDFKSDPYTPCNIWNLHVKCTDFHSILYSDTFSVHSAVRCHVLHTLQKNNDIHEHFQDICSYTYHIHAQCRL